MEGLFKMLTNIINVAQDNLLNIFLIVLGSAIIIKITSNIVKIVVSIAILILFVKLMMDMGFIALPMPLLL